MKDDSGHRPAGRGLLRPTRRLLQLALIWLLIGALVWLSDALASGRTPWLLLGFGLALVAAWDGLRAWREQPGLKIERRVPARWPVHAPVDIALRLAHRGRRTLNVRIHDLYPVQVRARRLPIVRRIDPGQALELHWQATAVRRGSLVLKGLHLAWLSPLGCWWRRVEVPLEDRARVYPNFNLVIQYGQLAGDRRLEEMGIHTMQRRGSGTDFHQLRDYREGDSLRQIDWHATSRVRKLIAKDYQDARDQRVVFLLDCSRRMRAMDGELSHFDQCLNALLLLAHVALKQGDEVALHTLGSSDQRERVLPAGRGQRQFGALLETVYDLDAGPGHPDFLAAATELMRIQRRRSLVVLMTNLRDEDHSELDPALALMRQRHLVVLADLRETLAEVEQLAHSPRARHQQLEQSLLEAGSTLYRSQRRAATRHLRQLGIIHLDLLPRQLAGALVTQYQRLKATGVF